LGGEWIAWCDIRGGNGPGAPKIEYISKALPQFYIIRNLEQLNINLTMAFKVRFQATDHFTIYKPMAFHFNQYFTLHCIHHLFHRLILRSFPIPIITTLY
jgi:hypothetical protein